MNFYRTVVGCAWRFYFKTYRGKKDTETKYLTDELRSIEKKMSMVKVD